MATTRQWTETHCGLQPLVVAHCESDPDSVRCSSVQTDRRFLFGYPQQCSRIAEKFSNLPTNKVQFISSFKDVIQTHSETSNPSIAPTPELWSRQRLENMLMRNVLSVGLKWVASFDYSSLTICLQLQQYCPLDPKVQITIEIDNDSSPGLRVTTSMFCARKYDLLNLQDGLGILQIKEEFVSNYIRHESLLKQVKELDDNSYTYEIGSYFVAEPSSPTEFSPKPVVRRLLLQVRHGKEIAATFTIRSNSDNSDTEGTSCAVEAMFPADEALFVSKWENRQKQWSARSSVRHNIEAVLGVDLAAVRAVKTSTNDKNDEMTNNCGVECAICFTHQETPHHTKKRKLGVTAQDSSVACERHLALDEHHCISCLNPKCDKVFHTECAKNWLYSLPSVKKSFGTMFGKCPYCGDVLEVKE